MIENLVIFQFHNLCYKKKKKKHIDLHLYGVWQVWWEIKPYISANYNPQMTHLCIKINRT